MEFVFNPFVLNTYDDVKPYLDDLVAREVKTKEETEQWIKDYDNLNANISENYHRRYVKHTCDTTNEELKNSYNFFITEIAPKLAEIEDKLNKKIITLPGIEELEKEHEGYEIWLRGVRKALEMFREENIPLNTEIAEKSRQFAEISGAMTIEHDGQTLTIQQSAKYLESPDREVRKAVYDKIWARRGEDREKLHTLLNELIVLRDRVAKNAGYDSVVEYKWDVYDRFDYTQQDVFNFHEGVKKYIVPIVADVMNRKREELGLDSLAPYDTDATKPGEEQLRPFHGGDDLLEKSIKVLDRVHPQFGENLRIMKTNNRFDLSSRKGKAPGGYNCPMPISRYPFVFMNAADTHGDIVTFLHESGHAMHSFYSADIPNIFNNYPMELAEVASMSMELLTLDKWDEFYDNKEHLKRAQLDQLQERTLWVLTWISVIDSFQYRMYKNPTHTNDEREAKFAEILSAYQPWVDWT